MAKNENNSSKNSAAAALPVGFVQAPAARPQTMAAVQANKQSNGSNGNKGNNGNGSPKTAGTMRIPGQPIPGTTNRPVAPDLGVDNSLQGGNGNGGGSGGRDEIDRGKYAGFTAEEREIIKRNAENKWLNRSINAGLEQADKYKNFSKNELQYNIKQLEERNKVILENPGTGTAAAWIKQYEPKPNEFATKEQYLKARAQFLETLDKNYGAGSGPGGTSTYGMSFDEVAAYHQTDAYKNLPWVAATAAGEEWYGVGDPRNGPIGKKLSETYSEEAAKNDYVRWKKGRDKGGNGGGGDDGTGGGDDDNDADGDGLDDDTGMVVVPGKPDPNDPNQINVVDYVGQIVRDPSLFLRGDDPDTPENESMWMEDHLKEMKRQAGSIDESGGWSTMTSQTPGTTAGTSQVNPLNPQAANSYDVMQTQGMVGANQMQAAQGELSQAGVIDPAQADMKGLGTGVNQDGSINYAGEALKKYAAQDISNIIDTSTVAGKLLADSLGEGNYTDSKATLKGQLEILQSEFVDPNTGEARIPSWAASTARNVSKIAAFKGMTGTAATAAMSQALLEASIPIAQADSQFFQTLTIQNLTNRQQSVINTANTLAKFEQTNVDNRMAAAIQNAKAFVEMDMKNLDNEQQTRVINNQSMIQSILEDAKQENAKRLFVADNQNEMDKFYDNLNTQISQFNSSQTLDASKFNATMTDSREKFYKEMQYNINVANAKWRQTVEVQEDAQQFEAAATDVKNMYDIGVNQLSQIWDRSDALLDYAWQSSEKQKDRKSAVALAVLQGQMAQDAANTEALGALAGLAVSDILNLSGRASGSTILGWLG